jgi:hypothetical protein
MEYLSLPRFNKKNNKIIAKKNLDNYRGFFFYKLMRVISFHKLV